jgi:hypothetical protein
MTHRKNSLGVNPWHAYLLLWLAFRAGMLLVNHDWPWFWAFAIAACIEVALIHDALRSES